MPEKKFSDSSDASRDTNPDPMDPTQWVDQFGDALFAFAVARTGDRSVAEDLVQDTFLAAV
ncbi:MAG: sigma factor, partial [Planctomycetota bacterium]